MGRSKDCGHLRHRRAFRVHTCVQQDDHEVPETEREPVALVGGRDGERDHEEAAHPAEQQQPEAARPVAIAFVSHA